jgi:hypothetical protein
MNSSFYLYGIFPAPGPVDVPLEGLDRQPVHSQMVDGFAFLYSHAQQERYLASRRNLLSHERVLEQAMEAGYRTLLPLQFGLVIADWSTVAAQLTQPHSAGLQTLFSQLQGQREVGVKVFWEGDRELQSLLDADTTLKAKRDNLEGKSLSMDEVVWIGQAIERGMEQRKHAVITAFREVLNPLATAMVENDGLMDTMIYNAAYLIPWDAEAAFSTQVEALDQHFDDRLKIRYNNFTAPYNFAQLDRL